MAAAMPALLKFVPVSVRCSKCRSPKMGNLYLQMKASVTMITPARASEGDCGLTFARLDSWTDSRRRLIEANRILDGVSEAASESIALRSRANGLSQRVRVILTELIGTRSWTKETPSTRRG